jgi:hypothetical protein
MYTCVARFPALSFLSQTENLQIWLDIPILRSSYSLVEIHLFFLKATAYKKGMCRQFIFAWKLCHSKASSIDMWSKTLSFLNLFFDFVLVFEILMLRFQNHSNYHFYFECTHRMLYAYLNLLNAHSKYSRRNISMNLLFLLVNSRKGESYWLISSLAHFLLF